MSDKFFRFLIKGMAFLYYYIARPKRSFSSYIPPSGKLLDHSDLFNMMDASLDMWLTTGRFDDLFCAEFSRFLGVKHTLTVNSGSSANLLAFSALTSHKLGDKRLFAGDEVIAVAAGFPTSVTPILQYGLVPVFIDCELGTYNIKASDIEAAITPKTKAIFLAHTLGNPFDLSVILDLCERYHLWLIEDSCDALGATYKGKKVGTFGHIGTYSFYPAHHITMGEGGAVVTNDTKLHKIMLSFRDWGRDCWCPSGKDNTCQNRFGMSVGRLPKGYDHKYTYSHIGFNLKITDWQAAIGLSQIQKLPFFLKERTRNARFLYEKLKVLETYFILPEVSTDSVSAWFGFPISVRADAPFSKQDLVEFLEANGVGTRQLFSGNLLRHPMILNSILPLKIGTSEVLYSNALTESDYALLPNTELVMNHTFWVGVFPCLGEAEMSRISNLIRQFLINHQLSLVLPGAASKRDYIIWAPPFCKSNGIRMLYRLYSCLEEKGYRVFIYSAPPYVSEFHYIETLTPDMRENAIVIYPETVKGNPLRVRNVVRWVLFYPGKLGGCSTYHSSETVFTWDSLFLKNVPILFIPWLDTHLFYDAGLPKTQNCYFVHKGGQFRVVPETEGLIKIDLNFPKKRSELAHLLQTTDILYSYDSCSAILDEAIVCGAKVKIITEDGMYDYMPDLEKLKRCFDDQKSNNNDFLDRFIDITQQLNYLGELEPEFRPSFLKKRQKIGLYLNLYFYKIQHFFVPTKSLKRRIFRANEKIYFFTRILQDV